jgi:hypothetical protein
VTFDGEGDSGQIESIGAWSGETAVDFPATEIPYAAITWDDPEVEMRQLSLEDVVEQLAYDFLSDTHGGWENNDGAYGEFCFDAACPLHPSRVQRTVHVVRTLHPRFLRGRRWHIRITTPCLR